MIESIKYTSADPHHRLEAINPDEDEEYRRRRAKRLQKSIKTQPELEQFDIGAQPIASGFLNIKSIHEEESETN